MSDAHPSSQTPRRRASDRAALPSAALVPVGHASSQTEELVEAVPLRMVRQDSSFVTHLIAIAERCPQTRVLRRASPQDAMAAYRAANATGHQRPIGSRTRQDV